MTQTVLLGDIAADGRSIISGPFGSSISSKFFVDSGVPVIRGNNLSINSVNRFIDDGFVYISREKADELKAYAHKDDIVLTAAGTLGQVGIIPADAKFEDYVISNKQIRVTVDRKKARPLFVYYALSTPTAKKLIESMNTGSTIPLINLGIVKRLPIPRLDLAEQDRIVNILGSIDEKIEENQQMNETLEQMGRALFRHYFIDNPTGEEWGEITLGDRIKPRRGKSLQSKNMRLGNIPVVSGGLQPAGLHDEANTKAPAITVSASGANAGFTALWGQDIWSADSSFIDKTITPHVYFYYLLLSRNQKRIYEMQTGSGQPHIYPSHLELLAMPNAPDEVIAEFDNKVATNFEMIEENKKQTQTLTTLRDTLLPRLMRGKVKL